jgi:hypothetical protein
MLRIKIAGCLNDGCLFQNAGVVANQSIHERRCSIEDQVGFVVFALLDIKEGDALQSPWYRPSVAAFLG